MNDVNVEYHLHGIPCHVIEYIMNKLKRSKKQTTF